MLSQDANSVGYVPVERAIVCLSVLQDDLKKVIEVDWDSSSTGSECFRKASYYHYYVTLWVSIIQVSY